MKKVNILCIVMIFLVAAGHVSAQNLPVDKQRAIQEKRQEMQKIKQNLRDERIATREAGIERRKEIKTGIKDMKDARKKQILENVQSKLAQINKNRTDHFLKILQRLSSVIDKIQFRSEKARVSGKNTSEVDGALLSARSAIAIAESAVKSQQAKTYEISVSDEAKAKNEVGETVRQLQQDLATVRDQVKSSSDQVKKILDKLKSIRGVDGTPVPTP